MEDNSSLLEEIEELINTHSRDQVSNTPDFILAEYLMECLKTFEMITQKRERWFGLHLAIGGPVKATHWADGTVRLSELKLEQAEADKAINGRMLQEQLQDIKRTSCVCVGAHSVWCPLFQGS